ncbi:hypothetical protein HYT52_04680 [Candidatus Woesearchaeota archaeon]|nr:hypothetical protein [Candidatus Woesearchaeota archaeon]
MTSTSTSVQSKVHIPLVSAMGTFNASFIDRNIEWGADAVLVKREGSNARSLEPYAERARERNVPMFVMADGEDFRDSSVIGLPVSSEQYWGVCRGLQKIVDQAIREGDNPKQRHDQIVEHARTVFAQPDFYDHTLFIDLMLNPDLRAWADKLPRTDKPIVVDCGHIDSNVMMSGDADEMSLEEGAVLVQYLHQQGFDAKLGVLYNEMRLLNQMEKQTARRVMEKLYQQAKREGTHHGVLRQYHYLLAGHGITPERHSERMISSFEGKLTLQCRQDLEAYQKGDKSRFVRELDRDEGIFSDLLGVFSYLVDGTESRRELTKPSGAPNCAMLSAKLNKEYERKGVGRVLYLRDEMEWGCAIRNGAATARELYGVKIPIDFIGYMEARERVATLRAQSVGVTSSASCSGR